MEIWKWELQKIANPGILAAIVLLGIVYYYMFPSFYIQYFRNGPNEEAEFALSAEWALKYGVTMEASERAELDVQLAEERADFQEGLLQIPEALAAGISDYDSFCTYKDNYYEQTMASGSVANMDQERLLSRIMNGTNYYRIQTLEGFMNAYDIMVEMATDAAVNENASDEDDRYTAAMRHRENEQMQSQHIYGFLPGCVWDSTREYGKDLAVWCVLCNVLLLSPVLVRDRMYRTRPMQWSSCRGRSVLRVQIGVACVAAFVVTMGNIVLYGIPFLRQNPLIFKDFGLESLWSGATPWFDWTYGTYLLVLSALIVSLSMAAALLTVFLSQYSANYIPMLLKALPLFVVLGAMAGSWLMDGSFYFRSLWQNAPVWGFCGMEAVLACVLLACGIVLCASAVYRQRRAEL